MKNQKYMSTDYSKGSVFSHILKLAIPITLANLITMLYNVVDRMYIGRIGGAAGTDALTGVGVCLPVITVIMAFSNLIGAGAAPLLSIERGRKNTKEAEGILGNSLTMLIIIGIIVSILCICFKTPILRLLGASDATLPYAESYLTISLIGSIFPMVALGLNSLINAQGYAKIGMMTIAIGAAINIILDPIFIFTLNMGVAGAAIATVISQICSAVWTVLFLLSKKSEYRIKLEYMLNLNSRRIKKILALGLTGFTMLSTNALVQIVCNVTLKQYGSDLYIGVMTIIGSVRDIIFLPIQGISQGSQPVLAYNYGADNRDRVKIGIKYMSALLIGFSALAWLAVAIMPQIFIGAFTANEVLRTLSIPALKIYFFGFIFMALQFSGQTVFTSLDKPKQAIFFSLFRKVIIVVPLTVFLPMIWNPAINGVFWAEPISNLIGGIATFTTMVFVVYRKL